MSSPADARRRLQQEMASRTFAVRDQNRHTASGQVCHHWRAHNLTCDEYDFLLARAAGHCELCGAAREVLVIDHFTARGWHLTRGLLCHFCNSSVMLAMDESKPWGPKTLPLAEKAQAYMKRWRETLSDEKRERVDAEMERRRHHREQMTLLSEGLAEHEEIRARQSPGRPKGSRNRKTTDTPEGD